MQSVAMKQNLNRCYYIDWLRVFAMFIVFIFHCGRFFDHDYWHVKNDVHSMVFSVITAFFHQWTMPLFFLLSGAASWFALGVKTPGQYLVARFKRLLIPYLVGIILFIPPQKYLEAIFYERFSGGYFQFLPNYFGSEFFRFIPDLRIFGYWGYHLWFLGFLFVFSLVLIPFSRYVQKKIQSETLFFKKPAFLIILIAAVAIIQIALRPQFPDYLNWADSFYWMIFFIFGFALFSNETFQAAFEKHAMKALITGIIAFIIMGAWFFLGNLRFLVDHPAYSLSHLAMYTLFTLNTWAWIFFLLGIARRYFNSNSRILHYSNEAVLPFYILHQTIILIIGYFMVQLSMAIIVKFLIITILSFVSIMLLYEILKRNKVSRFILGIRLK